VTLTDTITRGFADMSSRIEAVLSALPQRMMEATAALEASSFFRSDMGYEAFVRGQLPGLLLHHCGLEVPLAVDEFQRQDLSDLEWDFRAPVLVAAVPPAGAAAVHDEFVVFCEKRHYRRPEALPRTRVVTPTKFGGSEAPPSAHFLAIMEVTTSVQWTHGSASREGLLERLEARLVKSFDRARSSGVENLHSITDLVAVVGVVAPAPYSASVRARLAAGGHLRMLRAMTDAGRFVFIRVAHPGSPTGSAAGASAGRSAAYGGGAAGEA
jgi:hypothetical protein